MGKYYQGKYILECAEKYEGNVDNVVFRSSWEYRAFRYCDTNPKIIKWASEEVIIPYISPLDKKMHRYFMDLKITTIDEYGNRVVTLVEIKPEKETLPPTKVGKKKERYVEEVKTYLVNQAKWAAARKFCQMKNWNFVIWTENQLVPESDAGVKKLKSQRNYEEKMKMAFKKKKSNQQLAAIQKTRKLLIEKINDKN